MESIVCKRKIVIIKFLNGVYRNERSTTEVGDKIYFLLLGWVIENEGCHMKIYIELKNQCSIGGS